MKTEFMPFSKMSDEEKNAYGVLIKQFTDKVNENILSRLIKNRNEGL